MEKYGDARQDTDDNITGSMRTACWVSKVTDRQTQNMKYLSLSHHNNGFAKRVSTLRYSHNTCFVTVEVEYFLRGTESFQQNAVI